MWTPSPQSPGGCRDRVPDQSPLARPIVWGAKTHPIPLDAGVMGHPAGLIGRHPMTSPKGDDGILSSPAWSGVPTVAGRSGCGRKRSPKAIPWPRRRDGKTGATIKVPALKEKPSPEGEGWTGACAGGRGPESSARELLWSGKKEYALTRPSCFRAHTGTPSAASAALLPQGGRLRLECSRRVRGSHGHGQERL